MKTKANKDALRRIENLERELEEIKRDLIKSLATGQGEEKAEKSPLFSVALVEQILPMKPSRVRKASCSGI